MRSLRPTLLAVALALLLFELLVIVPSFTGIGRASDSSSSRPPQLLAHLKEEVAPFAQVFEMTSFGSKIWVSFEQGYMAGYSGIGGIYSIDPTTRAVKMEFPYSAVNAWWLRYGNGGNFPGVAGLGGAWGHLADTSALYFGGYGIDDNHAYILNVTTHTVSFLDAGTKEIWSMAKLGSTFYAASSFDLLSSSDMKTWSLVTGTHRNMAADEGPIWGMTTLGSDLYAVSNYLYRVGPAGAKIVYSPSPQNGESLKAITTFEGKVWFTGFANDVNSRSTWLFEYDPNSGLVKRFTLPVNAVTDIIAFKGNLWMTGFTAPRTITCGCTVDSGNLHGNVGILLRFDGSSTKVVSQVKGSEGLLGIATYGDDIYFGTETGDLYRERVT